MSFPRRRESHETIGITKNIVIAKNEITWQSLETIR